MHHDHASAAASSSSSSSKGVPAQGVALPLRGSFAELLATARRRHELETGYVLLKDNIADTSTAAFAEVFSAENKRVGVLGTAAPLKTTRGIKATCDLHKNCKCWINLSAKQTTSEADRWMVFRSLCDWLAEGPASDAQAHADLSFTLRCVAGMTPRVLQRAGSIRGGLSIVW